MNISYYDLFIFFYYTFCIFPSCININIKFCYFYFYLKNYKLIR